MNSAKRKEFEDLAIRINYAKNLSIVKERLEKKTGCKIIY